MPLKRHTSEVPQTSETNTSSMVINPLTNRTVKVGGKTWRKLIRDGIIKKEEVSNVLYVAKDKEHAQFALNILKENKEIPKNKYISKSGNKIICKSKPLSQAELSKYVSETSIQIFNENKNNTDLTDLDDAELSEVFQKMIMERMISNQPNTLPNSPKPKFRLETPVEEEEEDEEEYSDE